MSAAPAAISRRTKALTLVPLLALSGAWTVSLVNGAGATGTSPSPLPGGGTVPNQAVQAPATQSVPGEIAPAVPNGSQDAVVAGANGGGIPAVALAAYQRSAQILSGAAPDCHIPWELVAAIGRVESDHGQFNGSTLDGTGQATPPIYGPVLDGSNSMALISDTDGGALDGNTQFDRAVGPMQFLPSTWQIVKVDADSDGNRDPQNINDSALAAGVYLCSGHGDLSTASGQQAAVFRYNHSQDYVDLVMRIAAAYASGDFTAVPTGTYGGAFFTPGDSTLPPSTDTTTSAPPASGSDTGSGSQTSSGSGSTPKATAPTSPVPSPSASLLSTILPAPLASAAAPLTTALAPVTNLLTGTQALNLCTTVFATIPDPLGLLKPLTGQCATKLTGMTPTQASTTLPTTLQGILAWLGH